MEITARRRVAKEAGADGGETMLVTGVAPAETDFWPPPQTSRGVWDKCRFNLGDR